MRFPETDETFRVFIRDWLSRHYGSFIVTRPGGEDVLDLGFRRAWEDYLCAQGLAGLGWPRHYGGHALSLSKQAIFHEEHAARGAPLGVNLIGHGILAPTLLHFGSEEQKARFLPGVLSNATVWCQGYSEPAAGSDLASLRTRMERQDDHYVLNGHKIWTSFANIADWCFVLARSDRSLPRHKGLSFILVDMRSPGVRVEPIKQLTGEAEFCEVFFEDVRVPVENRVGEENDGWKIAMAAASFERGTYFLPRLIRFRRELGGIREWLEDRADGACDDSTSALVAGLTGLRQRWARLAVDSRILRLKAQRALMLAQTGKTPGPEGSATKVHWSEAHQSLMDLAMDIQGQSICVQADRRDGTVARFTHAYLWSRAETILAGTSEIQRNIIAERLLGLPKGA